MTKGWLVAPLLVLLFSLESKAENKCQYACTEEERHLTESVTGHTVLFQYKDGDGNWKDFETGDGDWTATDTLLEVATCAALYADWRQTREIAKHPVLADGRPLSEGNPLLPRHPNLSRVNNSFIITALLHPVITYLLPRPFREGWQVVFLAGEGLAVVHNYDLGLGPKVKGKMGGGS